ncbi:hypothetical protein GCM10023149_09200 [Mucilaginibacter gynuensis]|uniref:Lipoprotein n=1 Tax=Mucilaginibacter gynuensis TaxID=1302236 RepID=A0ABP8FYQ9_9SPHI
MNRSTLIILLALLLVACNSPAEKKSVPADTPHQVLKTDSLKTTSTKTPVLNSIEGRYVAKPLEGDTEACDMWVEIVKEPADYSYTIKLNGKTLKGKATVSKTGDETFINFEGIKWAEYEGDISNESAEHDTTNVEIPVGIDASLEDHELIIQNTGNAMNYYVKFSGCDAKYIRLVKN